MLKINRRGLFFITLILLNHHGLLFCSEDSKVELEPIVITKSATHSLNYYSLEAYNLRDSFFNSPLEALSLLPLDLESRSPKGAIQTDFSLRGSNYQGVLLLIDGRRVNDPQTGHHNADVPLTKEDIEAIEVIPPAGSSIFGPDAIGGAINIVTKKPKEQKKVLEVSLGQYQTGYGLLSFTERLNNLAFRFSLENQESAGFYTDTDFKKFTTAFNSMLKMPEADWNFNFGYQEKEFGAYDFYTPASGYLSKEWTKTYLVNTDLDIKKNGFIFKPAFLWRRHYDKFALDKTMVRSRYLNHHRTDIYAPNFYAQNEIGALGKLGLGLEYTQERINSTNLGKHTRNHKSVFFDESKDITSKFSLSLSFRSDDYDGFGENHTGSLSLRYGIPGINELHFDISRSMRIPSFTELYYNDPTTLGDAGLSAEKSLSYGIGYDYKKENRYFGATLFLRQEEDFIDWIKRTSSQAKWQAENITEAEVFGVENYLKFKVTGNLNLDSNYTYINKRINDRGYLYKYGPNYVKHLINTILSLDLPFGVQGIGLNYKKKPRRNGWFILSAHLGYNLNKSSQIFLNITNLLNSEYQEIEGIPQPGRWAEAGIRFTW